MAPRKPTLSKAGVNYRNGTAARHCGNCVMFHEGKNEFGVGTCDMVLGLIMAHKSCDKWEAKA